MHAWTLSIIQNVDILEKFLLKTKHNLEGMSYGSVKFTVLIAQFLH